jgi:hypothetical protein
MLNVGIARRSSCGKKHFLGRKTKFSTVERKSSSAGIEEFLRNFLVSGYLAEKE